MANQPRFPGLNPDNTFEAPAVHAKINQKVADDIAAGNTPVAAALNAATVQVVDKGGLRVFGAGNAATDVPELQAKMNSAATFGVPLLPRGPFAVNATLKVPTGLTADFSESTITQTAYRTTLLEVDGKTNINITNLHAQGLTTDYANTSAVYAAAAFHIRAGSSRVSIKDSRMIGFAGAGVRLDGGVTDVSITGNRIVGPGPTYITSPTFNFGGGVVMGSGLSGWEVSNNEISGYTQGIVTGNNQTDVRITNNWIHDIPGQHGMYLESMNGGVISGNLVRNAALAGMKIQVGAGTITPFDADSVTISDNVFINTGEQGILLTNTLDELIRLRTISVTGNVIRTSRGSAIALFDCAGINISGNIVNGTTYGMDINNSTAVTMSGNHVTDTTQSGVRLSGSTDVTVDGSRIIDPGSAKNTSTNFGILVLNNCVEITLRDNKITDSRGNMRYGIYTQNADMSTTDIIGNTISGATDYGWRAATAATAARSIRGNRFSGALGTVLNPPANFTAIASPAAELAALKTAVDALRDVVKANGLTA